MRTLDAGCDSSSDLHSLDVISASFLCSCIPSPYYNVAMLLLFCGHSSFLLVELVALYDMMIIGVA